MNVKVQIDARTLVAYVNNVSIQFSPGEFLLDCMFLQDLPETHLDARLVSSPTHTKQLARALASMVARYEAQYGEIRTDIRPAGEVVFEKKDN